MDGNRRILLVDDDIEHLAISKLVLERKNYDVQTLDRCDKLLETIKQFQPQLIFMDHTMPGMTGLQATRLIKSHALCKHIPVVYFTGREDVLDLALKAGADDWLTKPFRLEEIRQKADKYLDQPAAPSQA